MLVPVIKQILACSRRCGRLRPSLPTGPRRSISSTDDRLIELAQRSATSVRSNKKQKRALRDAASAAKAFSSYYRNMYGNRWDEGLCDALLRPNCYAALLNRLGCNSRSSNGSTGNCDRDDVLVEDTVSKILSFFQADENKVDLFASGAMTGVISIEQIPWILPPSDLSALWVNRGTTRLPPPSSVSSSLYASDRDRVQKDALFDYYCLDPASLLPVLALDLTNKSTSDQTIKVLDMCAAPGGKLLAILLSLFGGLRRPVESNWTIVANELSRQRRKRLEAVLSDYVPTEILRGVVVKGVDGVLFGSPSIDLSRGLSFADGSVSALTRADIDINPVESYSHVLCDVPCSGERHILSAASSLAMWKSGASRHLQKRQLGLLKAAVSACRPGGTIVYSTCSMSKEENDGIVERLLRGKKANMVETVGVHEGGLFGGVRFGEKTKFGYIVLPDDALSIGMGPMYICVLKKKKRRSCF